MSYARKALIKEELRTKIRPLMTAEIVDAVKAIADHTDEAVAQFIALTLGRTPPWSATTAALAGEILKEEAGR